MQNFNDRIRAIKAETNNDELFDAAIVFASDITRDRFCRNGEQIHIEDEIIIDGVRNDRAERFFVDQVRDYTLKAYSEIHKAIMSATPSNVWADLFEAADEYIESNDPYREPYNFHTWTIVDSEKMSKEELDALRCGDKDHNGYLQDRTGCKYYLFSKAN